MNNPERRLHVAEFKVRLMPDDAELLRALAQRNDMPTAVLARQMLRRELLRRTQATVPVASKEGPCRAA